MGATVPPRLLRCILNSRDMVTLTTADFQPQMRNGGILPPDLPGLGITVNRDALSEAVAFWGN
jgi:L-alanine-DL-glutamate epimerase-like enolase superfamily enzyme